MIAFEEIDANAIEYGWKRQFTKSMHLGRRYDRGKWTVRIFATSDARAISRASIAYNGYARAALIAKHAGKLDTVLGWLRDPEATR